MAKERARADVDDVTGGTLSAENRSAANCTAKADETPE